MEDISLFDANQEKQLEVVKVEFKGAELHDYKELFEGFKKLKAITFSSGVNFVNEIVGMFDESEIIFGCEDILSGKLQETFAFQAKIIDKVKSKKGIIEKVECEKVHLFVSRQKLSHEKIYILEGDNKTRVITGSANMSYKAFKGKQREDILYFDNDERAYKYFSEIFNELKIDSVDDITIKALSIENIEDTPEKLPLAETVKAKQLVVVEPDQNEDVKFVIDVKNLAKKYEPAMPEIDKKTKKINLIVDAITSIKRKYETEESKRRDLRAEYPALVIDVNNQSATLNEKELDLNPSQDDVKKDVDLFIKYMSGYSSFHGDAVGMQNRYYEFFNWFFCSPLMATMRDAAATYDQNRLPYPVFGLLYGKSKAGKTTFLETLLKMMIGQKPKMQAPEFTRTSIETAKYQVKGAPIIVDDLTNQRFNQHAIETIKNDDFGVLDHLTDYPAVVISANEDVKAPLPEVVRRTIICRVNAGLTNTEVMKSSLVKKVQHNIGTAFYREYLRRMLELMPDLLEQIKDDESESGPDILNYSSKIISEIIHESVEEVPDFVREITLNDYFGEKKTADHAIKTIQDAWKINKKLFIVSKKTNELKYDCGDTWAAERLMKELPETLEAHKTNQFITMDLKEAKEFFGINFRHGIFG